jgi:hypothetical protein
VTTQSSLVVVAVAAGGRLLLASAEVDAQVASFAHASSVELAISVLAVSGQLDSALLVVAVLAHAARVELLTCVCAVSDHFLLHAGLILLWPLLRNASTLRGSLFLFFLCLSFFSFIGLGWTVVGGILGDGVAL